MRGDDTINAGAGFDVVFAGSGNDTITHIASENVNTWDVYKGGRGTDTLRLELTSAEWNDEKIRSEVIAFASFLSDGGGRSFKMASLGIKIRNIEALTLVVDGEVVDPLAPEGEPVVIDLGDSSEDEVISVNNGASYEVTTGSGDDEVQTGDGDDRIDAGDGNNLIFPGAGDDVVFGSSGDDTVIGGSGAGDDIYDLGEGRNTVAYTSATMGVSVDLRELDRSTTSFTRADGSGDTTIGEFLSENTDRNGAPFSPNLPVGLASGAEIDTDILIGIDDVVFAETGSGNDTIIGNEQDNLLQSGAGNDVASGGDGDDRLEGGEGDDELNGDGGADRIIGGAGNDTVNGGAGRDTMVFSGNRNEYVIVSLGGGRYQITDTVPNRDGVDEFSSISVLVFDDQVLFDFQLPSAGVINGTPDADTLNGSEGNDQIFGFDGDDILNGFGGGDNLDGGRGEDTIDGGDGFDSANYSRQFENGIFITGRQAINADLSNNTVFDEYGDQDTVFNVESLIATEFDDTLISAEGGSRFSPGLGADSITGSEVGFDTISYDFVADTNRGIEAVFSNTIARSGFVVDVGGSVDEFASIEELTGSGLDDILLGGIDDQNFFDGDTGGNSGSDLIDGGEGFDRLDLAGTGNVIIDMQNTVDPFVIAAYLGNFETQFSVTLNATTTDRLDGNADNFFAYTDGYGNTDYARSIERVDLLRGGDDIVRGDDANNDFRGGAGEDELEGRGGDDTLTGGLGNDVLIGGEGSDQLFGNDDNDVIAGGTGDDQLWGGFGADEFQFFSGDGTDSIFDFQVGTDFITLESGLLISSLQQTDLNGDGADDTLVTLSSGDEIQLFFVTGLTDGSELIA